MTIRRILFPTDFSDAASGALPHAAGLARRHEAELVVFHARLLFADDPNRPEFQFLDEGAYEDQIQQSLGEVRASIDDSAGVSTLVERGPSAASAILQVCEQHGIDMIVMGTHGRSALGHFLLGSEAEKVVRHAACPVLTVASARPDYRSNPDYRKVLVAYDFSDHARAAAVRAVELAGTYGADVTALFVVEQEIVPAFYGVWSQQIVRDLPEIRESAVSALGEALGEAGLADVNVQVEAGSGDGRAHSEIARVAADGQYDLIVMGTHGLSGIDRFLLGSTTEKLVRVAPCPVLSLHGAPG